MLRQSTKRKKRVFIDYSKRKKQRYLLVEFIPLSTYHDPQSLARKHKNNEFEKSFIGNITPDRVLKQIQVLIEEWFGLYSLAHAMFSRFYHKFIYFNEKTGLAILACPQKLFSIMTTVLSLLKMPTNNEVYILRTISTSGSIKKCKRAAAQYQLKWINEKGHIVSDIKSFENMTPITFTDNDMDDDDEIRPSSSFENETDDDNVDRFVTLTSTEAISEFIQLYAKNK